MATRNFEKLESFSEIFKIEPGEVERLGFFDITPAVDSPLYIDPKLLTDDVSPFFVGAKSLLTKQFEIILLAISKIEEETKEDIYWEAANNGLKFKELQGTCLGYSIESTMGHAVGRKIRSSIISRIRKIMSKGYVEPEILDLVCVFTDDFGCDLASDLITYLIRDIIFKYNRSIITELKLESFSQIKYMGYKLLENPYRKGTPIILLPKSILSDLPVFYSFKDIELACQLNEEARRTLQTYLKISGITRKTAIFNYLMSNDDLLKQLIDNYSSTKGNLYDYESDPLCVWKFRIILNDAVNNHPEVFLLNSSINKRNICDIATECLNNFKHLIEDCGGRNQITHFKEKGLQFLFFASSYSICKSNGVDLCPEVNHGQGPIDFYLTNGIDKVSIEAKKSTNTAYLHGLQKQLPAYMKANESKYGFYLFFNYDNGDSEKINKLYKAYNKMDESLKRKIKIVIIDSFEKESASKIK